MQSLAMHYMYILTVFTRGGGIKRSASARRRKGDGFDA